MAYTTIFPNVYMVAVGPVNVYLVQDGSKLALIDTGYDTSVEPILAAVQELGKQPSDIANIVVTHCHPDHAGGLAALQQHTDATSWMHHTDAEVVRGNAPMPRMTPSPDILSQVLYRLFIKNSPAVVPRATIDNEISDGDELPIAGGLRAIHTPGHSTGHMSFVLPRDGGLLFVADACSNLPFLNPSIGYEDRAGGLRSLAKLATIPANTICFGHGKPLSGTKTATFARKWRA